MVVVHGRWTVRHQTLLVTARTLSWPMLNSLASPSAHGERDAPEAREGGDRAAAGLDENRSGAGAGGHRVAGVQPAERLGAGVGEPGQQTHGIAGGVAAPRVDPALAVDVEGQRLPVRVQG